MENILIQLKDYLSQALGLEGIKLHKTKIPALPFLLMDLYNFYEIEIINKKLLLFMLRENEKIIPGIIKKHIEIIRQKTDKDIFFLCGQLTSYVRRDFIKFKISFIVPGRQMYLPLLGIDLREYFRQNQQKGHELSPAAQALVFYAIHKNIKKPLTASYLADQLGYTCMTIVRAINEITALKLAEDYKEGKERITKFGDDLKELWKKALPYMKSPVKREISTDCLPNNINCYVADLNALAEYTMVVAPKYETFAISKDDWLKIKDNETLRDEAYECKYKLQIWSYAPVLFAEKGIVDKLSLYLSLMHIKNERIEKVLEEMMENFEW